jgi:hypothetical protein
MDSLPEEIRRNIFSFDPTGRDLFQKTLHQLSFCKVLTDLEEIALWKGIYDGYSPNQNPWYKNYFVDLSVERIQLGPLTAGDRKMILDICWKRFCKKKLK